VYGYITTGKRSLRHKNTRDEGTSQDGLYFVPAAAVVSKSINQGRQTFCWRMSKFSSNFEETLLHASGNFEKQNEVLETSKFINNYYY
jgi:hypothetical protein